MISDDAKAGLLDWLFGKKPLEKAAQTGQPIQTPTPPVQDNSYVKKQVDKMEQEKQEKVKKEALDKLKVVK